jgi:hypothetical protein
VLLHVPPAALVVRAVVVEAGELEVALPARVVREGEALEGLAAVRANGFSHRLSSLEESPKTAPGAEAPGA